LPFTFCTMIQSYTLKCSQSSQTNHKLTGYRNKRSGHKWKRGAYIGRSQHATGERLHGNVWRGIMQHVPTRSWHQGLLTGDEATSQIIVPYCSQKKIQCSSVRIVTNLHAGHPRNLQNFQIGRGTPWAPCSLRAGGDRRFSLGVWWPAREVGDPPQHHGVWSYNFMLMLLKILMVVSYHSTVHPSLQSSDQISPKICFPGRDKPKAAILLPTAVRDWSLKFHPLLKEGPTYNQ
jgi:hypothetical protein